MNRTPHLARAAMLALVAAAVTLALPSSAFAQRGAGGQGGFGQNPGMQLWMALDGRFDEIGKQLSLTEAQSESVKKLMKEFTDENEGVSRLKALFAGMRERRGQRGGGGGAGGGRGGGGMQGMQEMRTLMQELGPAFEGLHDKVTELLDEEQKETLKGLLQWRRPGG